MWDITMTILVGVLLFAVLLLAAASLVVLPALVVASFIQRRRPADSES